MIANLCIAGEELLLLDPHGIYLPEGEESVSVNLFNPKAKNFFAAPEVWPGNVAPFQDALAACSFHLGAQLQLPKTRKEALTRQQQARQ